MEPKEPMVPWHLLAAKAAQKGKSRCYSGISCAHQLSSCAIRLLMVTFRLSVAQRGERGHQTLQWASPCVVFLVTQKSQGSVCYSCLLELYWTESFPLQPVLL